ncbi:MAG TPA: hypothetical protein VLM79_11360, partial [Kofleriaceae bacterium]|nr:hypothetical protein [Kofleriaceae bacterium]
MVLSRTRWPGFRAVVVAELAVLAACAACAACGDGAARVRVVAVGGACARPELGNLVKVTAYTASGETARSLGLDETLSIADFPADTEQIGIEVGVGGGDTGAAGKSAPLEFGALANGAVIPVFLGPPDGFCAIGPMTASRGQPLIAPAGRGALIVGGVGPDGALSTAEYYDAETGAFSDVAVPEALVDDMRGFAGAALATLPDGRVALVGGPSNALVVFDPVTRAFSTPALIVARAFHAAIATGPDDVLVAGGCAGSDETCTPRRQTALYHLADIGEPVLTAVLPNGARIGAQLFDLGVQLDGKRRFLLAGGTGDVGRADRFALDDVNAEVLRGGRVQPAALDGGAVLTAFADDATAAGAASVYAPDAAAAQTVGKPPDLKGVRLIALEDGRVAGFGGDAMGRVLTYDPTRDAWTAALPETGERPGALTAPSLARLADGSVLVIDGIASERAWLYRPSLVGPASGSVTALAGGAARGVLTAPDPGTVTRMGQAWLLTSPGEALTARALAGGPRMAAGSVFATVHVRAGGVALIAEQTGPGQAVVAEIAPDAPPRLLRLDAGAERVVCSATSAQPAFDPAVAVNLAFSIAGRTARLAIADNEVFACDLGTTERGAWGIAALGAGA